MVNTPFYDPNRYEKAYALKPLTISEREYIDNDSFLEHPILFSSGGTLLFAKEKERKNPDLQKYLFTNGFGSLVFLNRNISLPYEPGSIFKPISVAIAIDSNAVGLYDYYNDPGKVMVGDFLIANVMSACMGTHTFSHALAFSCNV
jgi:cell division protein FtsI/penicillin-binding protein 2